MLIVYNICGLSGRENIDYYLEALDSINNQNINWYTREVLVSACCVSEKTIEEIIKLKSSFKFPLYINHITDKLPVNVTFNHSVLEYKKRHPFLAGYCYVDSGIKFNTPEDINNLNKLFASGPYSMVASRVENDFIDYFEQPNFDSDWIVPLGKAVNLHCQIFSHEYFQFYNRLMPDIFYGHCSESVLSFMAAAIRSKWIVSKDVVVKHKLDLDGQSTCANISEHATKKPTWLHPFKISEYSFCERLMGNRAKSLGLGYEECRGIMMHNENCYDSDNYAKNPDLKEYIKENLFLTKEEFDYDKVKSEWI